MKKLITMVSILTAALILLNGCVVAVGGGKTANVRPTVGQQLVDLKKAHETGAISDEEYAAQRAKVLEGK